jgi:hypothetical protein
MNQMDIYSFIDSSVTIQIHQKCISLQIKKIPKVMNWNLELVPSEKFMISSNELQV